MCPAVPAAPETLFGTRENLSCSQKLPLRTSTVAAMLKTNEPATQSRSVTVLCQLLLLCAVPQVAADSCQCSRSSAASFSSHSYGRSNFELDDSCESANYTNVCNQAAAQQY